MIICQYDDQYDDDGDDQYDDEEHQYDEGEGDGSPVDRVKLHPDDRIVRSVLDRALHLNLSGHCDDGDGDGDDDDR